MRKEKEGFFYAAVMFLSSLVVLALGGPARMKGSK